MNVNRALSLARIAPNAQLFRQQIRNLHFENHRGENFPFQTKNSARFAVTATLFLGTGLGLPFFAKRR